MKMEIVETMPVPVPDKSYVLRLSENEARMFLHFVGCRHSGNCHYGTEVEEFVVALERQIIGQWPA